VVHHENRAGLRRHGHQAPPGHHRHEISQPMPPSRPHRKKPGRSSPPGPPPRHDQQNCENSSGAGGSVRRDGTARRDGSLLVPGLPISGYVASIAFLCYVGCPCRSDRACTPPSRPEPAARPARPQPVRSTYGLPHRVVARSRSAAPDRGVPRAGAEPMPAVSSRAAPDSD
jgi:hypothetical protein